MCVSGCAEPERERESVCVRERERERERKREGEKNVQGIDGLNFPFYPWVFNYIYGEAYKTE